MKTGAKNGSDVRYVRVPTAGFVSPQHALVFEVSARYYRCGAITGGVSCSFDDELRDPGGVIDFDALCAVVDEIRYLRAAKEAK